MDQQAFVLKAALVKIQAKITMAWGGSEAELGGGRKGGNVPPPNYKVCPPKIIEIAPEITR